MKHFEEEIYAKLQSERRYIVGVPSQIILAIVGPQFQDALISNHVLYAPPSGAY